MANRLFNVFLGHDLIGFFLILLFLYSSASHARPHKIEEIQRKKIQSIMDPHPPKEIGPWFEGWYTRWTDFDSDFSIALITTSFLTSGERYRFEGLMSGYLSVAFQMPGDTKLKVIELFPNDTYMTSGGKRRLVDRQLIEETDFNWISEKYGLISQDHVELHAPGLFKFEATFSDRTPWSELSNNLGPGHLSAFLSFIPLHWYVFSLRSQSQYSFTDLTTGKSVQGTAWAHQEKNWGEVFPSSWIWLQAISENGSNQLALAGGKADLGLFETEAFIGTARINNTKVDFSPVNMFGIKKNFDSCKGRVDLSFQTFSYFIEVEATAPIESFGVLSIPTVDGYLPGASESFVGSMKVFIYRTSLLREPEVVAEHSFNRAAIEYGGNYLECWPAEEEPNQH